MNPTISNLQAKWPIPEGSLSLSDGHDLLRSDFHDGAILARDNDVRTLQAFEFFDCLSTEVRLGLGQMTIGMSIRSDRRSLSCDERCCHFADEVSEQFVGNPFADKNDIRRIVRLAFEESLAKSYRPCCFADICCAIDDSRDDC